MPDVIVMNRKEMGNSHSLDGGVAYIIIARHKKSEYHNLWESIKRVFLREREKKKVIISWTRQIVAAFFLEVHQNPGLR